ncbi:hypothetical protein PPL_00704 [Heterostelium album PN500]|uniref:Uncharacterized protein n=1 Tax=Heterostelium pallidum (strain ATCC 26659 / Pp 5 / PN500) TaxID=670386 RepID=D3AX74_HETP5|nr:hypothetical protein PPL_00704 [Heterostelium album PN500]EFA86143.1 hypothetical protein PPL_00704 [Heterostelium album PN500]|eukprot:XP_020438248.1 hypothetical protein PPL_00704 [Heterostelium album PN500]
MSVRHCLKIWTWNVKGAALTTSSADLNSTSAHTRKSCFRKLTCRYRLQTGTNHPLPISLSPKRLDRIYVAFTMLGSNSAVATYFHNKSDHCPISVDINLSSKFQQQIELKYYNDIQHRIPREDVQDFANIVQLVANEIYHIKSSIDDTPISLLPLSLKKELFKLSLKKVIPMTSLIGVKYHC